MTTTSTGISVSDLETFQRADLASWLPRISRHELAAAVETSAGRIHEALDRLKARYHAKDALIDLLAVSAVAGEPLLILGPPGTAKSDIVRRWCKLLGLGTSQGGSNGYFEYLLTTFTEPGELFGAVDIAALREGNGFRRKGAGMLQEARVAFLDEIFRSSSAILNSLLSIINERIYHEGGQGLPVPLVTLYAASNHVPAAGELTALLDRFPLRYLSESVGTRPEDLRALLDRGWAIETGGDVEESAACLNDVLLLGHAVERCFADALGPNAHPAAAHPATASPAAAGSAAGTFPALGRYLKIIRAIRAERVFSISDRTVIKLVRILAAAALLSGSAKIEESHLSILLHVWERPEDREQIRKFVEG